MSKTSNLKPMLRSAAQLDLCYKKLFKTQWIDNKVMQKLVDALTVSLESKDGHHPFRPAWGLVPAPAAAPCILGLHKDARLDQLLP